MRSRSRRRLFGTRTPPRSVHYHRIALALLITLLTLLVSTPLPEALRWWTIAGVAIFVVSTLWPEILSARLSQRCDRPWLRLLTAQVGILSLAYLLGRYAVLGEPTYLWLLYSVVIMGVRHRRSTGAEVAAAIEILAVSVGVEFVRGGGRFEAPLLGSSIITSVAQAAGAILLGLLASSVNRAVADRDGTIERYSRVLSELAHTAEAHEDLSVARKLLVRVVDDVCDTGCCSIWRVNPADNSLTLRACAGSGGGPGRENGLCTGCSPSVGLSDLDSGDLRARVLETREPHLAGKGKPPPSWINKRIERSNDDPAENSETVHWIPQVRGEEVELEVGVPISESSFHDPESVSVLYAAFEDVMRDEEMTQVCASLFDIVSYLRPVVRGASAVRREKTLRELSQAVVETLDPDIVLDRLNAIAVNEFGFGYATTHLVDEEQGVIGPSRWRHAPRGMVDKDVHRLNSNDIHACVARQGESEVIVGWDPRIDDHVWQHYGHRANVRVYVPLRIPEPDEGRTRTVGVLEAGLHDPEPDRDVARRQASLLEPFAGVAAVAVANAQLYTRAKSTAEALKELHRAGDVMLSDDWDSEARLERALDSALNVLGASFILVYLREEDSDRLDLLSLKGDVRGSPNLSTRLGQGTVLDALVASPRPHYIRDAQGDPRLVDYGDADGHKRRTFTQVQGVKSFAGLPLFMGGRLRGLICINYREPRRFTPTERDTIELFSQQVARVLHEMEQRERERERYRAQIVNQERSAFSQQLHSSVAQDLNAIAFKAQYVLGTIEGTSRDVRRQVEDILEIAVEGKRGIQYRLSELSASLSPMTDFRDELKRTVARVRRYYPEIVVRCELEADSDEVWSALPADTHYRLHRIAKDAFNNAVLHAECEQVKVSCRVRGDTIFLTVADDGVGFEPDAVADQSDSYGLAHIRENASALGGDVHIDSAPGEGATVAVRIPLDGAMGG